MSQQIEAIIDKFNQEKRQDDVNNDKVESSEETNLVDEAREILPKPTFLCKIKAPLHVDKKIQRK